jgi:hypothetical protein
LSSLPESMTKCAGMASLILASIFLKGGLYTAFRCFVLCKASRKVLSRLSSK